MKKSLVLLFLTTSIFARVTISHNGIQYGEVTSPITGRVWLDRNLGAKEICTSVDDKKCFGDYYQWGRLSDGHEKYNSRVVSTPAKSISNAGKYFINWWKGRDSSDSWIHGDDEGENREKQWLKTDGSSVCPVGFRVPTIKEIAAETNDRETDFSRKLYRGFLKLPKSGIRKANGEFNNYSFGGIWSSTPKLYDSFAYTYDNYEKELGWGRLGRSTGVNIRCIKN